VAVVVASTASGRQVGSGRGLLHGSVGSRRTLADPGLADPGLADPGLAAAVRAVAGVPVAAVLLTRELPTDIRHQAKIDRARVAGWAGRVLSGRRAGRP
jgi:olefin beta-lactone synthetase